MPKNSKHSQAQSPYLLESDVRRVLSESGRPLNQVDLLSALGVDRRAAKALRGILKAMLADDNIELSARGLYSLPSESQVSTGVLRLIKGRLYLGDAQVPDDRARLRPGDRVSAITTDAGVQITDVLERSTAPVVGLLRRSRHTNFVDSMTPGFRGRVMLTNDDPALSDGDTVEVEVDEDDGRGLVGRLVRLVVADGEADRASATLLASHGVPTEFPQAVIDAASKLSKRVGGTKSRRDLSDLPFVTIDGEDARDFDDALYCSASDDGFELWVAIADVGHYVKPGSALDVEALSRGNSVYLPDRVVPMLPEALSNDLCSLRPEERRMTLVCKMLLGPRGAVRSFEFFEAVIRSWARLTYTDVGAFLQGAHLPVSKPVIGSLRQLHRAFKALRKARERRGGLDFDSNEVKLELHEGRVVALHPVLRNDAHMLVEEAMIAANVCAAMYLEDNEAGALYRNHEPPSDEKWAQLKTAFEFAGVPFDVTNLTPKSLAAAMAALSDREDKALFDVLILRSLMQANYTPDNKGHFGLGLTHYAHFTSPIRRYPDLVVHRAIKALCHGKQPSLSGEGLAAAGEQCSMTERRAEDVERGVTSWLKCEYLSHHLGEQFDGMVMAVTSFGLFVELDTFYLQGLVHISNLGSDYFSYQPENQTLVGERSGRRFALGDRIDVVLTSVEPEVGKIDLMPVETLERDSARSGRGGRNSRGGGAPRKGGRGRSERGRNESRSARAEKVAGDTQPQPSENAGKKTGSKAGGKTAKVKSKNKTKGGTKAKKANSKGAKGKNSAAASSNPANSSRKRR